jgi:hypothetical protein
MIVQFNKLYGKTLLYFGGAGKEHFHCGFYSGPYSGRTGNEERPLAATKLTIQNQKRHPTEMISMKMREQNATNLGRVYAGTLHGNQ